MKMLHWMPRSICLRGGRLLGLAFYILSPRHRRLALRNLRTAFGAERSRKQRRKIARRSFVHFGGTMADFFYIGSLPAEKQKAFIRLQGKTHLESALDCKKGVLIFTGHFGFWEMASSPVSRMAPLRVIARPMDSACLERIVSRIRKNLGAAAIPKHNAGRHVLRALNNREIAAILIDQNVLREESVFVDFFGKAASTTPALAAFHLRTKAPVLPVFCRLTEKNIYLVEIHPPLELPKTGNYQVDTANITQRCTYVIEDMIRTHPEQWLWFHDRWRSRPETPQV
jgi:Kdo2-lipid IVA lauroyltransferase/acyltransferase